MQNTTRDLLDLAGEKRQETSVDVAISPQGLPIGLASQQARTGKSSTAFKTISEVAEELDVQQHVLRFWETKFSQVRPLKRGGGRRYYRPEDVQLLHTIHKLLYTEGYTIKGVQKLLRDTGKKKLTVSNEGLVLVPEPAHAEPVAKSNPALPPASSKPLPQTAPAIQQQTRQRGLSDTQREILDGLLNELKEIRSLIKAEE